MSDGDEMVTIEIPLVTVKFYANGGGVLASPLNSACRTALAKRQVDTRAERLHLPWHCAYSGTRVDGYVVHTPYGIRPIYEGQATLMAAAPALAEALDGCLRLLLETIHNHGRPDTMPVSAARAALQKAGWIDG